MDGLSASAVPLPPVAADHSTTDLNLQPCRTARPTRPDAMSNRPHYVLVTAAWRAEMARRQATYAARRYRHTQAHLLGEQPEPPTDTGGEKRPGSRTITPSTSVSRKSRPKYR